MYHLGQYESGTSLVHRLDPRTKILATVIISILILPGHLRSTIFFSAFLGSAFFLSGMGLGRLWQALKPMSFFFILLFLLQAFFTKGQPLTPSLSYPFFPTWEGLYLGFFMTLKFILLVVSAAILTNTTLPMDIVHGLERILRPLKIVGIPSHDMALMVSLALGFVPLFMREWSMIKEAQMARGMDFQKGNPLKRLQKFSNLVVPLLLNAFQRADELALAMESRRYLRGPKTYLRELHFSRTDLGAACLLATLLIGFFLRRELLTLLN